MGGDERDMGGRADLPVLGRPTQQDQRAQMRALLREERADEPRRRSGHR